MFCTTKFGYELIKSNEKEFRYDIVWSKQLGVGFLQANKAPLRSHEMIYVFSKAGAYYKRVDIVGDFKKSGGGRSENQSCYGNSYETVENDNTGKRCVKSVVEISSSRKKGNHPTEKPMELYKWLIERYCPTGGNVLDPTAGSCNSLFSAYELDRNSIGIEKDKGFYDKACKRIDLLQG
jgi:site-specific DNA-methyltransferase (adenine-specific)